MGHQDLKPPSRRVRVVVERRARQKAKREGQSFRMAVSSEWQKVQRSRRFHARDPSSS